MLSNRNYANIASVDTSNSFALDTAPLFPTPTSLLRDFIDLYPAKYYSQLSNSVLQRWKGAYPSCSDIIPAILWTATLSSFVNEHASRPGFWREDYIAYYMLFVLHQVLSIKRRDIKQINCQEQRMKERIRLALIFFLGHFKRLLGLSCGGYVDLYMSKVNTLLLEQPIDWSPYLDLHLWTVVVCAIGQEEGSGQWAEYVHQIGLTMSRMNLTRWEAAMDIIRGITWIDAIAVHEVQALGKEVEQMLRSR